MPCENRAAQFAPFAALTGYDAAIRETGRLTGERIELGESAIETLNMKIAMLADMIADQPEVVVTYFQPDEKKCGGFYATTAGVVRKIDDVEQVIIMTNGEKLAIGDILDIGCELFKDLIE